MRAKKHAGRLSGLDWLGVRLCEQKNIALRVLKSPIRGNYCACADLQTNPGAATPRVMSGFTQLLSAANSDGTISFPEQHKLQTEFLLLSWISTGEEPGTRAAAQKYLSGSNGSWRFNCVNSELMEINSKCLSVTRRR